MTRYNTPENPSDLSDFAYFPEIPMLTDALGKVTIPLMVVTNCLESVDVVAYDWSVYKNAANTFQPIGFQMLSGTPSAPPDTQRMKVVSIGGSPAQSSEPCLIQTMQYVPVVVDNDVPAPHNVRAFTDQYKGGYIIWYNGSSTSAPTPTFEISDKQGGWKNVVDNTIKLVKIEKMDVPVNGQHSSLQVDGLQTGSRERANCWDSFATRFRWGQIIATQEGDYRLTLSFGTQNKLIHEFTVVRPEIEFISEPKPVRVINDAVGYAVFPLSNPQSSDTPKPFLKPKAKVKADGVPDEMAIFMRHLKFPNDVNIPAKNLIYDSLPLEIEFRPTSEQDEHFKAIFELTATLRTYRVVFDFKKVGNSYALEQSCSEITELAKLKKTRYGTITPLHLICADVSIESPKGSRPASGADGSMLPAGSSLLIFDTTSPGQCEVFCETTRFPKLSAEAKSIVWEVLEWEPAKRNGIDVSEEAIEQTPVSGEPWKTRMLYKKMPELNDAYGNTDENGPLILRFKERKDMWKWTQPVQFRFNWRSDGASKEHHAKYPETVASGYPNWYFYWLQVVGTGKFNHPLSGTFGPQTTGRTFPEYGSQIKKMIWTPNIPQGADSALRAYYHTRLQDGIPDAIEIFGIRQSIFEFVRSIHHENGHRQSKELQNAQGGWGAERAWIKGSDQQEIGVHIIWENYQKNKNPEFPTDKNERWKWREAWEHGLKGVENGSGLCPRNEGHVLERIDDFRPYDWSYRTPLGPN